MHYGRKNLFRILCVWSGTPHLFQGPGQPHLLGTMTLGVGFYVLCLGCRGVSLKCLCSLPISGIGKRLGRFFTQMER